MNQSEFIASLENALLFCGHPFSRAALQTFVADAWPLIDERPDVAYWAAEFIAVREYDNAGVTLRGEGRIGKTRPPVCIAPSCTPAICLRGGERVRPLGSAMIIGIDGRAEHHYGRARGRLRESLSR